MKRLLMSTALLAGSVLLAVPVLAEGERDVQVQVSGPELMRELELLSRLAPLKLTDKQLDDLLAVYAANATKQEPDPFTETTLAGMQAVKARLLAGQELTKQDETVLNGIRKLALKREMPGNAKEVLAAIGALLTPDQIATLSEPPRPGLDALGAKGKKPIAAAAMKQVERALDAPDERWPGVRARAADALVARIGDAAERQATRENVVAFLDRLRGMDKDEVARRHEELVEELAALLPEGVPYGEGLRKALTAPAEGKVGAAAGQAADERTKQKALVIFLAPNMPRLLAEMKAARAQ